MELQDALIVVNGNRITVADTLAYLKSTGVFRDAACRLVELNIIRDLLPQLDIELTDAEVYEYANAKRRFARLERAEQLNEYCRNNGITMEQWMAVARDELMLQKVRAKVVAEEAVLGYFRRNREQLKSVALSRIVCREGAVAHEVYKRATVGRESFTELARNYSVEESTRNLGGYVGAVRRKMLPVAVEDKVFNARANDVAGPFSENGYWSIYKVEAVREPELSAGLRREISEQIFKAWLQGAIAASRFEKPK